MAYAAAAFADSCLKAMAGQPGIEECAYVQVGLHFYEIVSNAEKFAAGPCLHPVSKFAAVRACELCGVQRHAVHCSQ